jgi:hypothetical protein
MHCKAPWQSATELSYLPPGAIGRMGCRSVCAHSSDVVQRTLERCWLIQCGGVACMCVYQHTLLLQGSTYHEFHEYIR